MKDRTKAIIEKLQQRAVDGGVSIDAAISAVKLAAKETEPEALKRLALRLTVAMSTMPFSGALGRHLNNAKATTAEELVENAVQFLDALNTEVTSYVNRQNEASKEAASDRDLIRGFGRLLSRAGELAGGK